MLKILKYTKRNKHLVIFGIIFLLIQANLDLRVPTLMSEMVNKGMMPQDFGQIYSYGGQMLLMSFISGICAITASFMASQIGTRLSKDLRADIFKKVESYSLSEFDKIGSASLITRTTNDVTQIQQVVVMGFRFLLYSPFLMINGILKAYAIDANLARVLLVSLPVIVITMVGISSMVIPLFKTMQKRIDKINLVLSESLQGIRVIRAFNKLEFDKKKFDNANGELMDNAINANKIMAFMQPVMMLVMNLTTVAIVWFGGFRIMDGNMQVGDMMAFIQYAMMIMFSVMMVAIMFVMLPRAQASAERINEVLEMESTIEDNIGAVVDENGKKGTIEFKNVSFSYPNAEEPVISNISFTSGPGEVTAIIGSTGAGKSSIVNLIPRFYDVTTGEIFVNGVDIKKMDVKVLRDKIGFVPQKAILFTGTIFENMRFGKKDATDEEILEACKIAQAEEFISKTEKGYETEVSQGGTNLSGGQKQRLSIARAIVKNPEIYIFDDSFSALDYKTDKILRTELKEVTKEATTIVIGQRITSVMDADRILVLNDGEIVGNGKHDELLKTCDVYKEIVASQLEEEEL